MTTIIIIITLIALICFIFRGEDGFTDSDYGIYGILGITCLAFYLFFHSLSYFTVEYSYEKFVMERNSFEETLKTSRESNHEYETAAIVKEIVIWNQRLSEKKFDNKSLLFDQYIDDRFEDLEPIK